MSKQRILVVDDDSKISALVRFILERLGGYEVVEENRAFAAVTTARKIRPHFILLDVNMPGKDGGDIANDLRKDPNFNATPIVFLTSLVGRGESGNHGGNVFLSKPVDPQLLIHTVRSLLPVAA